MRLLKQKTHTKVGTNPHFLKNREERPMVKTKARVDMTSGSIVKHIILFAVPLLLGNAFQLLYNTVDTWVVGNFVNDAAYSAVGSVGPICNMLVGFFAGLASGAGVVISQYYGAGKHDGVSKATHTAVVMTAVMALAFTLIGVFGAPYFLRLMSTPDEVFPEAKTYLTIYFAGLSGLMFYNIGAGILRAIGDSRRPFYFLVVSALLNTVLDLLFVIKFEMGVAGVAYATIISQGVSAVCVFVTLFLTSAPVRLSARKLRPDFKILGKIIGVGIPAAVQMAITSFSNIFVQGYINFFGKEAMGAWTTFHKLDQFLLLPMQTVSIAVTTFVGQNIGAGQYERSKKGVRVSLLLALIGSAVIMIPILIFAPFAAAFFNDSPSIVSLAVKVIYWITPMYLACCVNQVMAGSLRGAGNSKVPMIIMLISFVGVRQAYLFIMANFISNSFIPIVYSMPVGWIAATVGITLYSLFSKNKNKLLVE